MRETQKTSQYAKAFLQSMRKFSHTKNTTEQAACSRRFLGILARKKELHLLPKIVREIQCRIREEERGEAVITSRFPLESASREKILSGLKKIFPQNHTFHPHPHPHFRFQTDENLLGGFSARYKDFFYDATVDGVLAKLKQRWR